MVLGEAGGCGTEGGGVGAVSDGGGGERKKVGDGVPGVEVEVFGEEDGVQEVVRGPVGGGGGGGGDWRGLWGNGSTAVCRSTDAVRSMDDQSTTSF